MGFDECTSLTFMKDEVKSVEFWRDVISEFLATFMLMSVQSALPLTWGSPATLGTALEVGMGMGFIVCTMAWTLGDFGGGHMNPAVTVAMALSFKVTALRAGIYILAQCGGAIAGAGFIAGVTPDGEEESLGATTLGKGVSPGQGVFVEMWITCILLLTIFGSTNVRRKSDNLFMATVPIGFAIALGIMAGFAYTGGSMNPARSLGPAVVKGIWKNHWVYWVGPIAGAALATLLYCVVLDRMGRKDVLPKSKCRANDH